MTGMTRHGPPRPQILVQQLPCPYQLLKHLQMHLLQLLKHLQMLLLQLLEHLQMHLLQLLKHLQMHLLYLLVHLQMHLLQLLKHLQMHLLQLLVHLQMYLLQLLSLKHQPSFNLQLPSPLRQPSFNLQLQAFCTNQSTVAKPSSHVCISSSPSPSSVIPNPNFRPAPNYCSPDVLKFQILDPIYLALILHSSISFLTLYILKPRGLIIPSINFILNHIQSISRFTVTLLLCC